MRPWKYPTAFSAFKSFQNILKLPRKKTFVHYLLRGVSNVQQTSSSDGQPEGNTLSALCIYSPSLQYGNLYTRTSRHTHTNTHLHTQTHIILQTPTQRYAPP